MHEGLECAAPTTTKLDRITYGDLGLNVPLALIRSWVECVGLHGPAEGNILH